MNTLWLLYFIILIIICVSQLVDPEGYDWLKEGESCPNADKEGDPLIINPEKYNSATMYSSSTWTESNCPIKYSHLPKVPRLAKSGQTNYKLDDFWYHFVQLHFCGWTLLYFGSKTNCWGLDQNHFCVWILHTFFVGQTPWCNLDQTHCWILWVNTVEF